MQVKMVTRAHFTVSFGDLFSTHQLSKGEFTEILSGHGFHCKTYYALQFPTNLSINFSRIS